MVRRLPRGWKVVVVSIYYCAGSRQGGYLLDGFAALDRTSGAGPGRLRTGRGLSDGDGLGRCSRGTTTRHGGRKDGEGE